MKTLLLSSVVLFFLSADAPGQSAIYSVASGNSTSVANFQADSYFVGGSASSGTNTIDLTGTSTNAYMPLYQSERYGVFTYTFPNLTIGQIYEVNLHFAELVFSSPGQRQFNVLFNGTQYLTNFDIVAEAGGPNRALVKTFKVTPNSSGQIVISFTAGAAQSPKLSGVEIFTVGPFTSGVPSASAAVIYQINAGSGAGAGSFSGDAHSSGGNITTYTSAVDTTLVNNPAPGAVYQTERSGPFTYTLPNLSRGGVYTVRLHFAENFFNSAGQRQFNVLLNGVQVLTNFDVIAAAGGPNRATVQTLLATPNASGQIIIDFRNGAADSPKVSGIELVSGYHVGAGGRGSSYWEADQYYNSGGLSISTNAIDTSHDSRSAPSNVYQSDRYGYATYVFPNLVPDMAYSLNLHFADYTYYNPGQREFNVSVNGAARLTNFDIIGAAGAANRSVVASLPVTANSVGQLIVYFTPGSIDGPKVSALEVLQVGTESSQFTIAGTVTNAGAALAGANLTLSGSQSGTSLTDANGNYSFTVASGGSYTITCSSGSKVFSPGTRILMNVISDVSGVNFRTGQAAGTLNPLGPAKEYIFLNGQIIAIESPH